MNSCPQCNDQVNPGNQCPTNPLQNYFVEIVINDNLIIPEQKPDVEFITNVTKNFKIDDVEVLDVDLGTLQGRKVVVAGTLTLGIEYSAAVPSQEVHFAHFDIPFKALIKYRPCDETNRGLLPADFNISDFNVRICVEHEQYHIINPRELSKVLVVLIWLEPLPTDLAVTKEGPDTGALNTPFDYTVSVTNNGPVTAYGVTLTDTVAGVVSIIAPPGCTVVGNVVTCNLGNLSVGQTVDITIEVTPTEANQNITNTAIVQASQQDLNPNNNTAVVVTTVPA